MNPESTIYNLIVVNLSSLQPNSYYKNLPNNPLQSPH